MAKSRQAEITPEELAERSSEMRTQGRAGAKLPRVNMALTPENYDFVKVVGAIRGMSMTHYVNWIIEQYRTTHPDIYERAKALVEDAESDK